MAEPTLDVPDGESETARDDRARLPVLLTLPFPGPLDYLAPPPPETPPPGQLVRVPLGRREEIGCVWDRDSTVPADFAPPPESPVASARLRPVRGALDLPPLPVTLRRFIDWLAAYTLTPPGLVLAMALRAAGTEPRKPALGWVRGSADTASLRMTPARLRVLAALGNAPHGTADLSAASGASPAVIRAMADAGLLEAAPIPAETPFATLDPDFHRVTLSDEQDHAAETLRAAVRARAYSATLLEGVTGSGKTEVYLEAVAEALRLGRQVLVLLPEIALSAQWTERFARRFGAQAAIWHSALGSKRRKITWRAVLDGQARVVVGARSALFLPFPDLGLCIVDEEHDTAFKQEDGVTYHGRDMAVLRARIAGAPVVLVSATPSLETLANVEAGRYGHLTLAARHGAATLPHVALIDMRAHPPERGLFLSPLLTEAMEERFARGEQVMLFLNRRGYAPLTLCRACGFRMECPNCTAWLVEHRARKELACHHCGHTEPIPPSCPHCGADSSLVPIGPGIERIFEECRARFPEARLLVMASDTLGSPQATADAVRRISHREVDLIIGTQIVAKGWHFPHLTLVGVVDADLGLGGGDLRAAERTVQLLHQVAGRAGRADAPGTVLLQSYVGEHPVMQALVSGDYRAFMAREAAQRRPGFWPPYGRLAALIISANTAEAADALARAIGAHAPHLPGVEILGPAPAPLALLRGRHRRRLLLRAPRAIALQPILRHWLTGLRLGAQERVEIDIDPVSFL
ncbi:primosomal protein N' [Acidomonas methanolica]|uniref:Replication restart protein PriA n=2 Tax=Acidomonas methanolica TaxID=437 RepID=A0A023D3I8_ACIMT|nr:primosomal protein N' [Acidomonas methanolica]MBU2653922.1 primosomal protein N' [Acidomonas methanolica]TCS30883.1 replication restart DNA helicase PriA [Acidomonas methanolica]GAJ28708.1 primosome assembly protein PriA [Acidomonas methanolica NBRC 104435]GEK98320.1 primosomal protein N' [Acidomonas methanolica NBRC 104435]